MSELQKHFLRVITTTGGGTSFAELSKVDGFAGDYQWYLANVNCILWAGMSRAAIYALRALLDEGKIWAAPTSLMVYLIDGMVPDNVPVANMQTLQRQKRLHWLPVVFWTLEQKTRPDHLPELATWDSTVTPTEQV